MVYRLFSFNYCASYQKLPRIFFAPEVVHSSLLPLDMSAYRVTVELFEPILTFEAVVISVPLSVALVLMPPQYAPVAVFDVIGRVKVAVFASLVP